MNEQIYTKDFENIFYVVLYADYDIIKLRNSSLWRTEYAGV